MRSFIKSYVITMAIAFGVLYYGLSSHWVSNATPSAEKIVKQNPNVTMANCGDPIDGLSICYVRYNHQYRSHRIEVKE